MSRYILRECADPDFGFYFDCDCYSEAAGGFQYTIFCVTNDRGNYYSGVNTEVFQSIHNECEEVLNDIDDIIDGYGYYKSVKECMIYNHLLYSPAAAHTLKELSRSYNDIERLCGYLNIKTGYKWNSMEVHGYCQGDYVEVIYCIDVYKPDNIKAIGEIYLGCGKEFCMIEIDENGNEIDACYGFIVADCEAWTEEGYIEWFCKNEGIDKSSVTLELIDRIEIIHKPVYKTYNNEIHYQLREATA